MPITNAKRRAAVPLDRQPLVIAEAVKNLQAACELLRLAGSKKAADATARAIKSAKGAHNHALRMAAPFDGWMKLDGRRDPPHKPGEPWKVKMGGEGNPTAENPHGIRMGYSKG